MTMATFNRLRDLEELRHMKMYRSYLLQVFQEAPKKYSMNRAYIQQAYIQWMANQADVIDQLQTFPLTN